MKRFNSMSLAAVVTMASLAICRPSSAQEVITTYYAPSVETTGVTAAYYAPTTTYYAPVTTAYYSPAPVTTYYPPAPVATYYAPTVAYYAPTPVTTYYATPVTTYYGTTPYYAGYGSVYYRPTLYVPGQPVRNFFRAL
jgi:hypothetical protein